MAEGFQTWYALWALHNKLDKCLFGGLGFDGLKQFWCNYKRLWPEHPVFTKMGAEPSENTVFVPIYLHADEGRHLKKEQILIFNFQSVLGQGTSLSQDSGNRLDQCQGLNILGSCYSTRFLITTLLSQHYRKKNKDGHRLNTVLKAITADILELYTNGVQVSFHEKWVQLFVVPLGLKGDWPMLAKLGNLSRSFSRKGRPTENSCICHLCLAGAQNVPYHDHEIDAAWYDTYLQSRPWSTPSPLMRLPLDFMSVAWSSSSSSSPLLLLPPPPPLVVLLVLLLNCDSRSTVFSVGPQPRPSTPSVPCRTSTTTIHAQCSLPDLNHDHPRPVFPAGPQPRPSTPSVPCRTSTASIPAQCSLPDLNHDHPRPVFPAGPQPRVSTPKDMPHRVPEDMPDRMLEDMPDRMPEGMPDRMPDRMSARMPEDMPDKVPECLPDRMPADLPDNMPEDMLDRMPDGMPEDLPDNMPEDMPDRMPDGMPEDMPEHMPEDMPEDMPEHLPEDMPEHLPEDMPGRMPEDMPDRMPDRMPENMSDRMPEDLPVTKCINVMVGITRSKV